MHHLVAAVTFPVYFAMGVPYIASGETWVDDGRRAMVMVYRNGVTGRALIRWSIIVAGVVALLVVMVALLVTSPVAALVAYLVMLVSLVIILAQSVAAIPAAFEVAFNPPKGRYWSVAGLAQSPEPSARFVGFELARAAIARVPDHEPVVVVARTAAHKRIYQRSGFHELRPGGLVLSSHPAPQETHPA